MKNLKLNTTIELTQKQVNRILWIGSIIIFAIVTFLMIFGDTSRLGSLGY